MSQQHTFHAAIQQNPGGGAFVAVPFDVEAAFGKKRVPVRATIDGEPYRGTLARMGGPCHMLLVLKEIRAKIGKQAGDQVLVVLQEDDEPREVTIPVDLQRALDENAKAGAFFGSLSYTHRKEYVRWIEAAKRQQTRADRVARTAVMLAEGRKPR